MLQVRIISMRKQGKIQQKNSKSSIGFTLVELMITVAIIGILASIAYPSYTDFMLRSNRAEAQRELMRLANLQEQVFVDTRSYAENMTGLGVSSEEYTTESGNYVIKVSDVTSVSSAPKFTLQAEAKNNQVNDTDCTSLKIDYLGAKSPKECWE